MHALQDLFSRERTNLRRIVHWIAEFEGAHSRDELVNKLIVNLICNYESLRCDARLSSVNGACFDSRAQCALEVCARHHDECIVAAELEYAFLDLACGRTSHCTPGLFAARQRYRFDARIDNYFFNLLGLNEERLENALLESGSAKDFFNSQRALRDIGRLL